MQVETPFGAVPIKVGRRADEVLHQAPEYDVCAALAAQHGVPVARVVRAALAALMDPG